MPFGTFTDLWPNYSTYYAPHFLVGRKGNKLGAYCIVGRVMTPMVPATNFETAVNIIYFTAGDQYRGTIWCYNDKGKSLGTVTGSYYKLQEFVRRTAGQ